MKTMDHLPRQLAPGSDRDLLGSLISMWVWILGEAPLALAGSTVSLHKVELAGLPVQK